MGKIGDFYEGKTVLLTGITGFLGKVILEKFLRALPQVKRIYVLIRSKKGSSVEERFKKVIHDSEIFFKLRQMKGDDFFNYILQKVVPLQGDLLQENLGLSNMDKQILIEEADIFLNCAASVDFNAKLHDAIGINVKGTLRMMDLAKQAKKVKNFVHVSTCYVNSDKRGWIEEEIYDSPVNARQLMEDILKIPAAELEKKTKQILGQFPNTYVFTKSAVERIIKAERPPNMTITIVRPSIIASSMADPCPGWVEGVSAATAVFLLSGIGLLRHIHVKTDVIGDLIPVDIVSDEVIVTGALCAESRQLNVFNCGTSSRNPMTWMLSQTRARAYWMNNPAEKGIAKMDITLLENETLLRFHHIKRRISALALRKIANLVGDENMKKNANRYVKLVYKAEMVSDTFSPFATTEWIFDSRRIEKILAIMDEDEKKIFNVDVSTIDWNTYLLIFNWGMQRFILHQNTEPPVSDKNDVLSKGSYSANQTSYFSDINWARTSGKLFKPRSYEEYKSLIFNSSAVQQAITQVIEERSKKQGGSMNVVNQVNREAQAIIKEMISDYKMPFIRAMAWFLHKVFKQIYEKVVIDDHQLKLLVSHDNKTEGPLILIPTHRSYIDFLLVSYIFFAYKVQCPHIAAAEDFLNVTIVHHILRACGAFFMKRGQKQNPIYNAIFYEYIQRLLVDDCNLEFFVEGTRSRSGKMLHPKFGVMGIVADAVFDNKIPDAKIVPITLNYEKVLEGDTFPYELLGEEKVKESLPRLIKAVKTLNMNFGKIHVSICQPIGVKQYFMENHPNADLTNRVARKGVIRDLAYEIEYRLTDKLVCLSTSIVSSLMLWSRKGISEDTLIAKVHWLCSRIAERGGILPFGCDISGSTIATKSAVNLLSGILIKSKKNIFEVEVTSDTEYKNVLMLHYYRNGLIHVFILEAIVCVVLAAFGQISLTEGVALERIWEETAFLFDLFEREYVLPNVPKTIEAFRNTILARMVDLGVVRLGPGNTIISADQKQMSYCCSLVWPLVETYWATIVYMFTLAETKTIQVKQFLSQAQWFTENLHDERIIQYHESCSLDTIKNAVSKFKNLQVINVNTSTGKCDGEEHITLLISEEKLNELESHIQKFLKRGFSQSVSVSELAKRTLMSEYPILARL